MTTLELTADIVSAYVAHNALPASELPNLIQAIHLALNGAGIPVAPPVVSDPIPAVPITKSIGPDFIVCLDTGKRLKSLRRHLGTLGMTPEQYRAKWRLPFDYPMVCSDYSARRSQLAKDFGLGRPMAQAA